MLSDFRPKIVLTRPARLHAGPVPPGPTALVERGENTRQLAGVETFDLEVTPGWRSFPATPDADAEPANLIYTSGSTGFPKAVVMSHRAVRSAVSSIATYLQLDSRDVILNALPLSFDYGLYQVLLSGVVGGCLVLEPGFGYPGSLLATLRDRVSRRFPVSHPCTIC